MILSRMENSCSPHSSSAAVSAPWGKGRLKQQLTHLILIKLISRLLNTTCRENLSNYYVFMIAQTYLTFPISNMMPHLTALSAVLKTAFWLFSVKNIQMFEIQAWKWQKNCRPVQHMSFIKQTEDSSWRERGRLWNDVQILHEHDCSFITLCQWMHWKLHAERPRTLQGFLLDWHALLTLTGKISYCDWIIVLQVKGVIDLFYTLWFYVFMFWSCIVVLWAVLFFRVFLCNLTWNVQTCFFFCCHRKGKQIGDNHGWRILILKHFHN